MSKSFLIAMIILSIAAVGVAYYKIAQDSSNIENTAVKIDYPVVNKDNAQDNSPENITICAGMTLEEAKMIANSGDCNQGQLLDNHICNEGTKTWWIDLKIDKEGCSPACVINAQDRTSEINWRCTGAILPKN